MIRDQATAFSRCLRFNKVCMTVFWDVIVGPKIGFSPCWCRPSVRFSLFTPCVRPIVIAYIGLMKSDNN